MRKDSLEIISNYLFRGAEAKISLADDEREMLLRIETCYTKWLEDPMQSDIEMRNFIMHEFNVGRQTALKILNYTIYALGNVNSAAKSFVRKKIDFLLTKAAAVAEAGDLKYAQTLTKIALAYGKAFDTGTDDIDLSEIRNNFTIKKVVLVSNPSVLGIKTDGRERSETSRILKKYDIPEDEILDIDAEVVNE